MKRAVDSIDGVIKIVRASGNDSEARNSLISKFNFSKVQAKAILEMRLRRLTGLEIESIESELEERLKNGVFSSYLNREKVIEGF